MNWKSLIQRKAKRNLIDNLALQKRINVPQCPVCNNEKMQTLWTTKITKVTTVICTSCSTIFNDDTLNTDDLELVGKHGGSLVSGMKMDLNACEKYFSKQYDRYQHVLELLRLHQIDVNGKRSLDLICEVGGGIKALTDAGARAAGMDLASDMWRFASENKKLEIHNCHILEHNPKRTYDFISGVRFINHFNDPISILSHVNRLLNNGGILYLETFDLIEALKRKSIEECVKIDHPISFTSETLKRILELLGFKVLHSSTDISNPSKINFGSMNHSHFLVQKVFNSEAKEVKKTLSSNNADDSIMRQLINAVADFQIKNHEPNFK